LRYFHVIGTRQNDGPGGGVASIFVKRALRSEDIEIHGDGLQNRYFTDVRDVAKANIFFSERNIHENLILNCANSDSVSVLELAKYIKSKTNSTSKITHSQEREGDIKSFRVINRKIKEYGFNFQHTWQASIDNIIQWYKSGGLS